MQSTTFDNTVERLVLSALLTDDSVLSSVVRFYKNQPFLFRSAISNEIAKYAVTFFSQYGTVPSRQDIGLFIQQSSKEIQEVLVGLPDPPTNSQTIVDQAARLFETVHWERYVDQLKDFLNRGNLVGCQQLQQAFRRVSTNVTHALDPFTQAALVTDAYSESSSSLIRFDTPDEAAFFQDMFARDTFVSFLGSEKSSKSFHIFQVGYQALRGGLNVAHFECGDLSQKQVIRRIAQRVAVHPSKPCLIKYPVKFEVKLPDYAKKSEIEFHVDWENRDFSAGLTGEIANQIFAEQKWYDFENPQYRLVCRPTRTLSVRDIDVILDEWSAQGWNPDFILIDYADILAVTSKHSEVRHQIDDVWANLRSLSQKWHCCLVTATQATGAAVKATHLTEEHVSEAKVKKAYVTAMLGIHSTEWEDKYKVKKLNKILDRNDEASPTDPLYEATCLAVANPCVLPYYPRFHRDNSILPKDYYSVQALINYGVPRKKLEIFMNGGDIGGFGDFAEFAPTPASIGSVCESSTETCGVSADTPHGVSFVPNLTPNLTPFILPTFY